MTRLVVHRRGLGVAGLLLCVTSGLPAQGRPLGVEFRAYPAGLVPALRGDWPVGSRLGLSLTAGYNFTDRRSWGEHRHESGGGPGIGLGLTRLLRPGRTGWLLGLRADFWTLGIDWRDPGRRGDTRVWVLQPTARVGRAWELTTTGVRLEATTSLGAELNLRTWGEPVGQGPIFLLGIAVLGLR